MDLAAMLISPDGQGKAQTPVACGACYDASFRRS
jgi:hypothetical protein